jgi:hypothetical protein
VTEVLAYLVLLVGVPLNIYVFVKLRALSSCHPEIRVLRERAIVAGVVLLVVVLFSFIFLNNDLDAPALSFEETKVITRLALLVLATVPASYWLFIYRGKL